MNKNKDKVTKKLISNLSSYPFGQNSKSINIFTLFCMIFGLVAGIFIDIYFLNFLLVSRNTLPILIKGNFSNNLRYGNYFFVTAIPIFCVMVGVGIGKGVEILLARRKK